MRRALLGIGLLAFLIAGCTKPMAAFEGKWQLDSKTVKSSDPKEDPAIGATLGLMVLDFYADKTFVLSSKTGDKSGTFEVDSGTVTMHLASPKSEGEKKPIVGKLTNEGKSMTVTGGGSALTLKFTKL